MMVLMMVEDHNHDVDGGVDEHYAMTKVRLVEFVLSKLFSCFLVVVFSHPLKRPNRPGYCGRGRTQGESSFKTRG